MNACTTVGQIIRAKRRERRLTLDRLGALTGCAKSYLSSIENDRRGPPGDERLERIEQALGMRAGELLNIARWQSIPDTVRREVAELHRERRIAHRLAALLDAGTIDTGGRLRGRLARAHRSGELRRLIALLGGEGGSAPGVDPPTEIPIMNTGQDAVWQGADEYVRVPGVSDPDAFATRVVGDSMEPEYRAGDIVVFSPARNVRSGADCFARLEPDHETTFRRAFFETCEGDAERVRLQPINPKYPPLVLPRGRVAALDAAVSVTRDLG